MLIATAKSGLASQESLSVLTTCVTRMALKKIEQLFEYTAHGGVRLFSQHSMPCKRRTKHNGLE